MLETISPKRGVNWVSYKNLRIKSVQVLNETESQSKENFNRREETQDLYWFGLNHVTYFQSPEHL